MTAFVGRDDVLEGVLRALARPPALVLIEGEAGIGKTRLVKEILWSGRWVERTVLMVECQPLATTAPLGAVVDGLRRLREEIGGVQLSPLGGALRPLFPEWAAELPPRPEPLEDAGARRHQVIRALTELVDRLGVEVVVVEDAHWADPATLEWLLAASEGWRGRRSVVVTFRPRTVPPLPPQLRRLGSRMPAGISKVRVVLQPLDVAEIQQLTAAMFRTRVSQEFAEFLYERTGGLPLAVEECLKLLRDRGEIVRKDGGWGCKELTQMREVPPNLRDSVLERVERLDPRTRRVLEAAAVLAEPADDRLLAKVADLDVPAIRSAVAAGFRAGLLRGAGVGRVAFRHQLAAEAVAAEIPEFELPQLHKRAGDALRRSGEPSVARLSRHFKEAGDVDSWAHYGEAVADLAQQSGDDRAAVATLYELITSVEHPGPRRARLARKLGEAAASGTDSLVDRAELVIDVLRQVTTSGDLPRGERGAIRLLLARLLRWYGQRDEADSQVEAAIEDLDDRPELACWAMLNMGVAFSRDWTVQQHREWIDKATTRFAQVESPIEQLHLTALRASALVGLGEQDGWAGAAEIPRVGSSPAAQRMILFSMADLGRLAIKWGRYDEAGTRLRMAIERMQAAGYQRKLSIARAGSAYLAWYTGQWADLSQTVAELAEAEMTEEHGVRLEAREIQGLLDLATGARKLAEQRLTATLEAHARPAPLGHQAATTAGGLGRLRLVDGGAAPALQVTGPVMARIAAKGLWLWATDLIWVHLEALIGLGELKRAEDLAGQFTSWLAGRDAPASAAADVLCRAIVARAGDHLAVAAGLFAQAAKAWAGLPRPYDELLALERQGRCLLAAEQPDRATRILADTHERLQELGARWDADRIARTLRQHGVDIPRSGRGGPRRSGDQLSRRERDVVALVAQGMTNREAARVMFLAEKTIEYYLGNAMRKLGVSTRTAAAMAAASAGLLPPASETPSTGRGAPGTLGVSR